MNWIERMYELKGKDLYSQNGEGMYLEYLVHSIRELGRHHNLKILDMGSGDGFYLSNTRQLKNLGHLVHWLDKENGNTLTLDNIVGFSSPHFPYQIVSIDIDGNDYWILDKFLEVQRPYVVIAEFNAHYTDCRTIKYDPDFVWAGDSYYGFTFEAGKKLAEKHGYTVIFQNNDLNMYLVRNDLIKVAVPPVTYKQLSYFKMSERTDWIML